LWLFRFAALCKRIKSDVNSGWILGKNSSQKEWGDSGRGCPGGSGVTVPGGTQKTWRCGTEGHGQWAWWSGLELDLVILEAFSNLSDSVTRGDLGLPEGYDDGLNLL